ncbi:MAG: type IVB secretion system protein IcmF [Legionellaceae bacterium]
MDNSLFALTEALKKVIWRIKPNQNPVSFLLLIGKAGQGKTSLLRQSSLEHVRVEAERPSEIYYNGRGIIIELNESWLRECHVLLEYTLKQLNHCHKTVRISGLILAIDINELTHEATEIEQLTAPHAQLLQRFSRALGYRVEINLLFTKLDCLLGFCDFFQQNNAFDHKNPLGFSLDWVITQGKLAHNYRLRFEQLIEGLGQDVIGKIHPARSNQKRTLIREFPLQLASLRIAIQTLLQQIPPKTCKIQSIYFTSAEQGGISMDHLNKKIQHEYGLTVPDKFYQSTNYRPYFIEAALHNIQSETLHHTPRTVRFNQWATTSIACFLGLTMAAVVHHHVSTTHVLDEVTKELLAFDVMSQQKNKNSLYHVAQASKLLDTLGASFFSSTAIEELKVTLHAHAEQHITGNVLPAIRETLERAMISPQKTPLERYHALRIYLMLNEPERRNEQEIMQWFTQHWQNESADASREHRLSVLNNILQDKTKSIPINKQTVREMRNYLNALPAGYLYYALIKETFPSEKEAIKLEGFSYKNREIPFYFTKKGFYQLIKLFPQKIAQLEADNWVLQRQDLKNLPKQLKEAYCYDYVMWWQHFMRETKLISIHDYQQAKELTASLQQSNAIEKLINIIQAETGPDNKPSSPLFNREIASQFSTLNFISRSSIRDLSRTIAEMNHFYTTLAVVNDKGRVSFDLTKSRFQQENQANPLSALYMQSKQLPEPIASWAKHLADDTWFLLLNETKQFINAQWKATVYESYEHEIANRYPFDLSKSEEISLNDFNHFFSRQGVLNQFVETYLKPFLDTSHAQWRLKESDGYVLPISPSMLNELIRANVITAMFFPSDQQAASIAFSLQKINLDPVVTSFQLKIGQTVLHDSQMSDSIKHFTWPEPNANLKLRSVEGNDYVLNEEGPWAFFKMLQKVNVLVDENDNASLEILFEINGNSGRYLLKTENEVNPFTPGILNGFMLTESIT